MQRPPHGERSFDRRHTRSPEDPHVRPSLVKIESSGGALIVILSWIPSGMVADIHMQKGDLHVGDNVYHLSDKHDLEIYHVEPRDTNIILHIGRTNGNNGKGKGE